MDILTRFGLTAYAHRPVAELPEGGRKILDVALSGNYAFIASGAAGVEALDLSTPSAPMRVGAYNTSGDAR